MSIEDMSKEQIIAALSQSIKQKRVPESIVLNHVLLMSQQSLCPDTYDMFLKAYNELIDIRDLPLEKLF